MATKKKVQGLQAVRRTEDKYRLDNLFMILPEEVSLKIMSYLDLASLLRLRQVRVILRLIALKFEIFPIMTIIIYNQLVLADVYITLKIHHNS